MIKRLNHLGFTIIELMIATSVFSVILVLTMAALLQIGRNYYQGVIKAQTQEVARSVGQNISESIQFSGGPIIVPITPNSATQGFCIDNKRFSYIPNKKLVDNSPLPNETLHALVVDSVSGCSTATQAQDLTTNTNLQGKELISPNMRVLISPPTLISGSTNLWQLGVTVIYGDDDLLSGGQCVSVRIGGQFCAVSALSTTVEKRVK